MTSSIPSILEIWHAKCDNEGCFVDSDEKYHYFIICSPMSYNVASSFILAIPLTSQSTNYALNYGSNILNEMLTTAFLTKQTFVLQDRPCRINKQHFIKKVSSIDKVIYKKITKNIQSFMEYQKIVNQNLMT